MIQIDVTLTLANTNYSLYDLVKAIKGVDTYFDECRQLQIQMDPTDVAGTNFRRGGPNLSDTEYGALFAATDFDTWGPLDSGGIFLSDIYFRADVAAKKLRLSMVTR